MKGGLFRSLARDGMRKNKEVYRPYTLISACMVALFYIILSLSFSPDMKQFVGMEHMQTILALGTIIIGFFSVIFLFFTNNYLMKRRKREFAIYNMLGMEKAHLVRILRWETVILSLRTLVLGLVAGALCYKLAEQIFQRVIRQSFQSGYLPPWKNLLITVLVFLLIHALVYLRGSWQIYRSSPMELMRQSKAAEKAPKVNALYVILGISGLASGYGLALSVGSPLEAIPLFFLAVMLVMIGTYFSFMSVSMVVLKTLQKNKKFYYKTTNFTAVSGLISRIRQHAVGLANICILSTAVLILLSSAVSLYLGGEDSLRKRFPREVMVRSYDTSQERIDEVDRAVKETLAEQGSRIEKDVSFRFALAMSEQQGDELVISSSRDYKSQYLLYFVLQDEINPHLEKPLQLKKGEVLALGANLPESVKRLRGKGLDLSFEHGKAPFPLADFTLSYLRPSVILVVPDVETWNQYASAVKDEVRDNLYYYRSFDLVQGDQKAFEHALSEKLKPLSSLATEFREQERKSFHMIYGAIFFTGIFMGLVFMLATGLSIYYKQLAEGYEDQRKFDVMKNVGMTDVEIKKSIRKQILIVFFLPLVMAGIHMSFAFPILKKMLAVLNMTNGKIFLLGTSAVYVVFAMLYFAIYTWTSKSYYHLVRAKTA